MIATSESAAPEWIAIARLDVAIGSGDCVRFVDRPDGAVLFFLADVAGHDARAARFARDLDALVSDLAPVMNPGTLLATLNGIIEASWPSDLFVSAICFSLNPQTGAGSIALAGQMPPLLRGSSSTSVVAANGGPALGVLARQSYEERAFRLAPGDMLVAATDGVADPLAESSDWLGIAGLSRVLDASTPEPVLACAALMGASRRAGVRDDATVLAIAPGRHAPRLGSRSEERTVMAA